MPVDIELTDHHLLLSEEVIWNVPPTDLDSFTSNLYEFYFKKGLGGLVLTPIHNTFLHVFVVVITSITIGFVNWPKLISNDEPADLNEFISYPEKGSVRSIFTWIYMVCSLSIISWRLIAEIKNFPKWVRMHNFYKDKLQLDPNTCTWNDIVSRLISMQRERTYVLFANQQEILPIDIASRVLRKENYLMCLLNSNILTCESDDIIVFLLWMTIIQPLFEKPGWVIKLNENALRKRCHLMCCVSLIFLPITIMMALSYYALRCAELSAAKSAVSIRSWSNQAYWKLRGYNEYNHQVHDRLLVSCVSVGNYLDHRNAPYSRRVLSLVKFISGSLTGYITVLTAIQEDALTDIHLFQRNLLWWLAFSTGTYAIARSMQCAESQYSLELLNKSREKALKDLKYITKTTHHELHDTLNTLYPYFFVSWLKSLKSIILSPVYLWRWGNKAGKITQFFRERTVRDEYKGDICTESIFIDPITRQTDFQTASMSSYEQEYGGRFWDNNQEDIIS